MEKKKNNKSPDDKGLYTCSNCGKQSLIQGIIDNWSSDENGGLLCIPCQKKLKKGWYDKNNKQ